MKKVLAILIIIAFLSMTFFSALAYAQEPFSVEDFPQVEEVNRIEVGFDFFSWFKKTFNIGTFSIVGDERGCGEGKNREPHSVESYDEDDGTLESRDLIRDECSSGEGILDVYTGEWSPVMEISSEEFVDLIFSKSGQIVMKEGYRRAEIIDTNSDKMWIEIYCCPYDECNDDEDCEERVGPGSTCEEEDADDPNIEYWEDEFYYCTPEVSITCWYSFEGDNSCSARFYAGNSECPDTYMNRKLYESKSTCEGNIIQPPECEVGETDCKNGNYIICENEKWVDKGKVDGKCGYEATCEQLVADNERCRERNDCVFARDNRCKDLNSIECHNIMYEEGCFKDDSCEWKNSACQEIIECKTFADKNCDGIVSTTEMYQEIENWLENNLSRTKLGEAINAWSD